MLLPESKESTRKGSFLEEGLKERSVLPEIPAQIEHLETIAGEEISLPQPVTDDGGRVIMDNVSPQRVVITLPLTEEEINQALHLKIIYSLRWLVEWSKRLLKIIKGKFLYKLTQK